MFVKAGNVSRLSTTNLCSKVFIISTASFVAWLYMFIMHCEVQ